MLEQPAPAIGERAVKVAQGAQGGMHAAERARLVKVDEVIDDKAAQPVADWMVVHDALDQHEAEGLHVRLGRIGAWQHTTHCLVAGGLEEARLRCEDCAPEA